MIIVITTIKNTPPTTAPTIAPIGILFGEELGPYTELLENISATSGSLKTVVLLEGEVSQAFRK